MLGQQIHFQSSLSDQTLIFPSRETLDHQIMQSSFKNEQCTDNCYQMVTQADENRKKVRFDENKIKLQKLRKNYKEGLRQLAFLEQKYSAEEKFKIQLKIKLEQGLNQLLKKEQQNKDKDSQTHKLEDQNINNQSPNENKIKIGDKSLITISILEKKLQELRNRNSTETINEKLKIAQLKDKLSTADKFINRKNKDTQTKQQHINYNKQTSLKIQQLKVKREQLLKRQNQIHNKINEEKILIVQLDNNTEYLKQTQNCCQQIFNQELNALKYKISKRKSEFETTKKHLQKIIRCRKYEENMSFKQIQSQIKYLNGFCDEMINKKSTIAPETKKYRHKRHFITDQIKQNNQVMKQYQLKKLKLNEHIQEQNLVYDQLEDQYFFLIENIDENNRTHFEELSAQEKCQILRQKQQILEEELQSILKLSLEAGQNVKNNKKLNSQKDVKELKLKISAKKLALQNNEILVEKITQLQKQNSLLGLQQQNLKKEKKAELQQLIQQQTTLVRDQKQLSDQIQRLKQNSQNLQQQVILFQEYIRLKKPQTKNLSQQGKNLNNGKQQKQKKYQDREKKNSYNVPKFNQDHTFPQLSKNQSEYDHNENQKHNYNHKNTKKGKSKKGKNKNLIQQEKYLQTHRPKFNEVTKSKQTAIQNFRKYFPTSNQQEMFKNSSLLASNPALWMFVFFFTVIIPGLCIGYSI